MKFGTTQFEPDDQQGYSPTSEFMSQSATAGMGKWSPPPGGGGVETPEEALNRRPFKDVGKSTLSLYGRSPVAMAPTPGPVPMPGRESIMAGFNPQEPDFLGQVGKWADYFSQTIAPILSPGGIALQGAQRDIKMSQAWDAALTSDDGVIRGLATQWQQKALSNEVDAYEAMASFYEQYDRITAMRQGDSNYLLDSLTYKSPRELAMGGDPGQVLGASFAQAMIPLRVLQAAATRSQMEGGDAYRAFGIIPIPGLKHADRAEETLAEYAKPDHGTLKTQPGLVQYTEMYKSGDLSKDEFLDLINIEGFAVWNPEQMGEGNWMVNIPTTLAMELLTDPLTIPSVLTGGTSKIASMSAKTILPSIGREAGKEAVETAARAAGRDVAEFALTAEADSIAKTAARETMAAIENSATNLKRTAASGLTPIDYIEGAVELAATNPAFKRSIEAGLSQHRVLSTIAVQAPSIIRVGQTIDRALDPLTLVGKGVGSVRARLAVSNMYAEGLFDALGWVHVSDTQRALREAGITDEVSLAALGRAGANHALQIGNRTVLQRMKAMGSKWNPTGATPTELAQSAIEMKGADVRGAMMRQVDETTEYIVPSSRGGASAGLAAWREDAARIMTDLGATGDVTAIASRMTEQQIRVLKHMYWGHMIEVVDIAKNAAMPTAKFDDTMIARVTMIGPRQLTKALLQDVLASIAKKDANAVRVAVARFDDLKINVSESLPDDELMTAVEAILKAIEPSIPNALTKLDELPDSLADFLKAYGDRGYQLGLRPADDELARVIMDADGNVLGVRAWVDNVVDAVPTERVGVLKAVAQDLTRGIAADHINRNAQRRFVAQLGDLVGASEKDSKEILRQVRKIAQEEGTTPRGLSIQSLERAVIEAKGVNRTITNDGRRAVVDSIMYAYQNEVRLVGVTQSMTGRMKQLLGSFNNWVGYISENIYPKVRFAWSPIFVAQEITELPYFLALRGQFPMRAAIGSLTKGKVFGEHAVSKSIYDDKTRFLMDYFANGNFVPGDMIEGSDLVRRGFLVSERLAGRKTPIGRWTERQVQTLANFFNLAEKKADGESVVYRFRMGEMFKKGMLDEAPSTWWAARSAYPKEMSDGEFAISWLYDLIARSDPEGVWSKTSPSMFAPQHVGKRAKFSPSLVGFLIGGDEGATLSRNALRARIRNDADELDFAYIEDALRNAGADAEYIERARWMLDGPDADEFYDSITAGGVSKTMSDAMRSTDQHNADLLGIGLNEYLGRHWAGAAQAVDQFGDQRGTYAFQLIVDSLESRGLVAPERGDQMLTDLAEYGQTMTVDWMEYARIRTGRKGNVEGLPTVGELPKDVQGARSKIVSWVGAREKRAADPNLGRPPVAGLDSDAPLYQSSNHTYGPTSYERWLKQLETAFPDEGTRREYADWYTDMQRGFLALFSDTPEHQVENAARLIVAFGVTQLNTSPALGMEFLYRVMSMARRGEDWPSALDLTPAQAVRVRQASGGLNFSQLEEILMERGGGNAIPFQLGQKLADFIDSLIGRTDRSVGIHGPNPARPWGPVAGDVWAKRDLGFLDPKVGDRVWMTVDGGASSKVIGDHKKGPDGKVIRDEDGKPEWARVDRIEVYDKDGKIIQTFNKDVIGESAPTDLEYDYIVEYYNGLADFLNERNYLGRRWTAADAQAVGWFRAKRAFGDATGDVRTALYKGRWTMGSEINPVRRTYAPPPVVDGPQPDVRGPSNRVWATADEVQTNFRAQVMTDLELNTRAAISPTGGDVPLRGEPNTVQSYTVGTRRDWPGAPTIRIAGYTPPPPGPDELTRVYTYYDSTGNIAGSVVIPLDETGEKAAGIAQVRVRADAQRKGVASAMYNQAEMDGLDPKAVSGQNVSVMGAEFSPAYKAQPVPYSTIFPPSADLGEEATALMSQELIYHIHNAALADSGVLSPRGAGVRFWDGKPVTISDGHYTTTLGADIDPATGMPVYRDGKITGGRYSRGRIVSASEKDAVRARGEAILNREFATSPLTYATENLNEMADTLHAAVTPSRNGGDMWGGATIDARTGGKVDLTKGDVPISSAIAETVELPGDASLDELTTALGEFIDANREALSREDHYVGIFRDDAKGTIDLDVNFVVYDEASAEAVQTALDRRGGAYNFDTGNGVYAAITRDEINAGKNTVTGYRINTDGEVVHADVVEVLGDRTAATQYAARVGYYSQMDEVVLIRDTNVTSFDYTGSKGKGNIGGVVRVPVRNPEEGAALLDAIAGNPNSAFPKGAHLAQDDGGNWMVQGLSDATDKRAYTKAIKGVDAEVAQALGREVKVETGPVEFIRVTNDWRKDPDGAGYLEVITKPSHVVSKFGERRSVPSETAGQLERSRVRELAARAEDITQRTVPREAAAARTAQLYAGPIRRGDHSSVRTADDILAAGGDGVQYQRAPAGTRAAIVRTGDGKHQLYLGGRRTRPDSLLHELAHKFAWELDPSAVRRIKGVRDGLEGKRPGTARGRNAHRLTNAEHEWFVAQYLLWINDPASVHTTLRPMMEAFRREVTNVAPITKEALAPIQRRIDAAKAALATATAAGDTAGAKAARAEARAARQALKDAKANRAGLDPEMAKFFDEQAAAAGRHEPPAYWDMDEDIMFQHVQKSHDRAARQASDLTHFKQNRSVVERSLNHPFFGLYPLSYMYGKVLPELIEFLMFRPFGFKAPGLAYNTTQRMYQSFMNQQEHDEELRQYLYENEPGLRSLAMFVPGVPWELPVNTPLWVRRIVEAQMTNAEREANGQEPLEIDVAKIIADVAGYQFGVGRAAQTLPETAEALTKLPGIAATVVGGQPITPEGEGAALGGPFKEEAPVVPLVPSETPQPAPKVDEQQTFDIGTAEVPAGQIEFDINEQVRLLEESLSQIRTE